MEFINCCKEVAYSKKFKVFDYDIIFMDCFHNINILKFKSFKRDDKNKKCKKEIINNFNKGKFVSINKFNQYLKEYNLYCCYLYDIREKLYYYKIDDITQNDNINNKFTDLD